MKHRALFLGVVAVTMSLTIPHAAFAKGASRATITGPGLKKAVEINGRERRDMETLANLSGIYPALFETTPDPMLDRRPVQRLGPRYEVAYLLRAPEFRPNVVIQELYPYAQPNPVTYVEPGQPVFGQGRSVGGWYQAGPGLLPFLVSKGLPAPEGEAAPGSTGARDGDADAAAVADASGSRPAPPEPRSDSSWPLLALVVIGAVAGIAAVRALVQRRWARSLRA